MAFSFATGLGLSLAAWGLGFLIFLAGHPCRHSLRDGWRCLRRYPILFRLPLAFAMAHALWRLWIDWPGGFADDDWITGGLALTPVSLTPLLPEAALPTLEFVMALLANSLPGIPLAFLFALFLLLNFRGGLVHVASALGGPWRWGIGAAIFLLLTLSLSSVLGVVLLALLYWEVNWADHLLQVLPWTTGCILLFSIALGFYLQGALMACALNWVRGGGDRLSLGEADLHRQLRPFRGWVIGVSLLAFVILEGFFPLPNGELSRHLGRGFLAVLILLLAPLPVALLAEKSWRGAWENVKKILTRHRAYAAWFYLLLFVLALSYCLMDLFLEASGGPLVRVVWRLISPFLWALAVGWLIPAWVMLYSRLKLDQPEACDLFRY